MQTKAGETSPKCALWRQDTLEKHMQIKFLEEVIVSSNKPMSFDISKNKVCGLNIKMRSYMVTLWSLLVELKKNGGKYQLLSVDKTWKKLWKT